MIKIVTILLVTFIAGIFLVMSSSVFADSLKPQQRIDQNENIGQKSLDKPLSQEQHHTERMQRKSSDKSDHHLGKPIQLPGNHAHPHNPGVLLHSPPGADD